MTAARRGRAGRPRRRRLGQRARRVLAGVLVAFSGALLLRPILLLGAALGDGDGDGLGVALVAAVYHVAIFVLALSLLRRASRAG